MIARDKEHRTELLELLGQEGKVVVFVRSDVAYVAKHCQVGCFWDDLENIIGFWGLQVQIREYLDRHT